MLAKTEILFEAVMRLFSLLTDVREMRCYKCCMKHCICRLNICEHRSWTRCFLVRILQAFTLPSRNLGETTKQKWEEMGFPNGEMMLRLRSRKIFAVPILLTPYVEK